MQELFELVESVAASEANILIQGENGTGKELIANAIHYNSKRSKGPFIKINCAAIPKDLIESELFGYKKGAFTGATMDKEGLFEMAEGGSLLLDEIGEMPPYLQTKLLRVLQEREYRPIGSDRIVHVDFRLICATNIDLDAALRDGRLREDLYFRINTITLRVPPLRERTEDIPLLCDHFLDKFRQRYQKNVKSLAPSVYHLLIRNRWPGNVRELENAIERAVLVAKGTEIAVGDLPESIREETTSSTDFVVPPHRTLAEIEKMAILQTLQRTNWNKQEAAQILGLYRPTLYSKMKKHDIRDAGKSGRGTPAPPPAPPPDALAARLGFAPASRASLACTRSSGRPMHDAYAPHESYVVRVQRVSPEPKRVAYNLNCSCSDARLEARVTDNSRATAATIVGGGHRRDRRVFLLYRARARPAPAARTGARGLRAGANSFRVTLEKAAGVASEGWKLLNEAMEPGRRRDALSDRNVRLTVLRDKT